jgi:hypothetical protein
MRAILALLCLSIGLSALPAGATTLNVAVTGAGSRPVPDAVVVLHAVGRATAAAHVEGPYSIDQRNIQFHPFVSVVPLNALVSFPNFDPVRHHVYSFSPAKRFELKLYAKDQTRSVKMDRAGIVALGCNIHDAMSAFIFITDSIWTAKTDAGGRASFPRLPAGRYEMRLWHPYLRTPGNQLVKTIEASGADRNEAFSVVLRRPPLPDTSGY